MSFDGECRDEALEDPDTNYKGVDFVTDALRHSKVKLTWDEDDPERNQITRRLLTKQEIEEADFKAYLASSTSGSESEADGSDFENYDAKDKMKDKKGVSRDKLRALLLRDDDALPEGWGRGDENESRDVDMEITFTPGLVEAKDKEETTLQKYERKIKEKRKNRKVELKEKAAKKERGEIDDDFFDAESEEEEKDGTVERPKRDKGKKKQKYLKRFPSPAVAPRHESTVEELGLLAASDNPNVEPKHFNLKSVLKAETKLNAKRKKSRNKGEPDDEIQEDFAMDVKDDRFKALHEDHMFAIDPSNPHFKKTKSMAALLEERSKRRQSKLGDKVGDRTAKKTDEGGAGSLASLVESLKRKSAAAEQQGSGKRRRL